MTIAVLWEEDNRLWCVADTRLVAPPGDQPTTEIAAKIYSIPIKVHALDLEGCARDPHYWTQYGFVFAGGALPASMTAITASTLLQQLARPGGRGNPPTFEELSEFVQRLSKRYMEECRRLIGDHMLFSAAFFGWCPHANVFKIAQIEGRNDFGSFRVELTYPAAPQPGDPWLVLGAGASKYGATAAAYRLEEAHIRKRVPRRVVERMVSENVDPTVGGSVSIAAAFEGGLDLFWAAEPITPGEPPARRIFNGLDLDTEIGMAGSYFVAARGLA